MQGYVPSDPPKRRIPECKVSYAIRSFEILGGEARFIKCRVNQTKSVGLEANIRT